MPIVFSRLLFKSPPDLQHSIQIYFQPTHFKQYFQKGYDKFYLINLASHAVLSAVKRSPVPTNAAGNFGIKTWGKIFDEGDEVKKKL